MAMRLTLAAVILALTVPPALCSGRTEGGENPDRPSPPRGGRFSKPSSPWATTRKQPKRLTAEQEKKLLAALKDKRPDHYHRLKQLQEKDPQRYRWMLQMMWRWYERWENQPKEIRDKGIAAMDSRVKLWRLARQLGQAASEEDKDKIIARLRDELTRQFDAEQKIRAHRLEQLEQQLKKMQQRLEQDAKNRDKIIARRLKQIRRKAKNPPPEHHKPEKD